MSLYDKSFYTAFFLVIGIGIGVYLPGSIMTWLGLFLGTLLAVSFLFIYEFNEYWVWLAALSLMVFPGYFYAWRHINLEQERVPLVDSLLEVRGLISGSVENRGEYKLAKLELSDPYRGELFLYLDPFTDLNHGDVIRAEGVVRRSEGGLYMSRPKIEAAGKESGWFIDNLYDFKEGILEYFGRVMPQRQAALLGGLTLGELSGFSKEFKENLNKSGTTHLVALSGYNITVLVAAIGLIFGYFFSAGVTYWLAGVGIALFVVMVGGDPSIVRAAVMGVIGLVALRSGRIYSVRNAVMISALLMLLFNPKTVAGVGFQLSFVALLGIVYLLSAIKNAFHISERVTFLNWQENLLATVSAQLSVAPLLLYYFGSFSWLAFISNILILELVPYAMLLGFLLGLVSLAGGALDWLGGILGWLVNIILTYQIGVIDFFARYASWNFKTDDFQAGFIFIYYGLVAIFTYNYYFRNEEV